MEITSVARYSEFLMFGQICDSEVRFVWVILEVLELHTCTLDVVIYEN